MFFRKYRIWLFCFALWACTEEVPNRDIEIGEELQKIVDSKTGPERLIGVSVSVRVDGEERWVLTGGDSESGVPVESNMKFGIASITKTVVGATILRLEEDGLLTLDDTIGDHLSLNNPNVDPSITIYQLLIHTSGLEDYFVHPDIWPRVEGDLSTAIPQIEIVDYIGTPRFTPPGETHSYSNANYLILGLIIESVTGKTVGEVMREYFWGPLNLTDTYFGSNETIPEPIAAAWRDTDGDNVLEDISVDYGPAYHSVFYCAADVFTTSSDLTRWAYELFEGSAISETSRDKMLTFMLIDTGIPEFDGYGLGVRRATIGGRRTYGHTGGMRGYGSFMFFEPKSNISVVVLNNQSRSLIGPQLRFELTNELFLKLFEELGI